MNKSTGGARIMDEKYDEKRSLIVEKLVAEKCKTRYADAWKDIIFFLLDAEKEVCRVDIKRRFRFSKGKLSKILGAMNAAGIIRAHGESDSDKIELADEIISSLSNKPVEKEAVVISEAKNVSETESGKEIVSASGIADNTRLSDLDRHMETLRLKIGNLEEIISKATTADTGIQMPDSESGGEKTAGELQNMNTATSLTEKLLEEYLDNLAELKKTSIVIARIENEKEIIASGAGQQKKAMLLIIDQLKEALIVSEEAGAAQTELRKGFDALKQENSILRLDAEKLKKDLAIAAKDAKKIQEEEISKLEKENRELRETNHNFAVELQELQEKERVLRSEIKSLETKISGLAEEAEKAQSAFAEERSQLQLDKENEIKELKEQLQESEVRNNRSSSEFLKLQNYRDDLEKEIASLKEKAGEADINRQKIADAFLTASAELQVLVKEKEALAQELDNLKAQAEASVKEKIEIADNSRIKPAPEETEEMLEIGSQEDDLSVKPAVLEADLKDADLAISKEDNNISSAGQSIEEKSVLAEQGADIQLVVGGREVTLDRRMKDVYSALKNNGGVLTNPEICKITGIFPSNLKPILLKMKDMRIVDMDNSKKRQHKVLLSALVEEKKISASNDIPVPANVPEKDEPENAEQETAPAGANDVSGEKAKLAGMLSLVCSISLDELLKEAENIIKEKEANPAAIAWKYLLEKMRAIINNPVHRLNGSGVRYPLNDDAIIPIVEKILETMKPQDLSGSDENSPLSRDEEEKMDVCMKKLNGRKNTDPSERIVQAVFCCHDDRGMPFDMIRSESGLQNFTGNFDEIRNRLIENGWMSVYTFGDEKTVKITPANIRRILKISRQLSMAEKLLRFSASNKNNGNSAKVNESAGLTQEIIKCVKKKGVAGVLSGTDLEKHLRRKVSEEDVLRAHKIYMENGGKQKITIEKNEGDYLVFLG